MPFRSFEDVDVWVEKKGPNGAEKLRGRIESGAMWGSNATWGKAWLQRQDRIAHGIKQSKEQELAERNTLAAEQSAKSAHHSFLAAFFAAAIAFASAVIAVLAYMKQ